MQEMHTNDLRNSPDPTLRRYYFETNIQNLQVARHALAAKVLQTTAKYSSECQEVTVKENCKENRNQLYISFGKYVFPLSRSLELLVSRGDRVWIQLHLTKTRTLYCYAVKALPTDPSSRLAISIRGNDSSGNEFHAWLRNVKGKKAPMRMNTLVDSLEGLRLRNQSNFQIDGFLYKKSCRESFAKDAHIHWW